MTASDVMTGRWELIRALGAVADDPAAARSVGPALGLEPVSDAGHTDVFVLNLPPYASVYLGPDGALGGVGTDRVAGFWRAIGIEPPSEPDHLSALLSLYASLGEASLDAGRPATSAALARAQASLFWEHLWSWLPGFLDAVADLAVAAMAGWARLAQCILAAEFRSQPPSPRLPLAFREAPALPPPGASAAELGAFLTAPARSGVILTRHRLALGACQAAVGHRIGERRFTLRAMLEQDNAATLGWLAAEAARWQQRHSARGAGDQAGQWWAGRAAGTCQFLRAAVPGGRPRGSPRAAVPGGRPPGSPRAAVHSGAPWEENAAERAP